MDLEWMELLRIEKPNPDQDTVVFFNRTDNVVNGNIANAAG
jgi:hypothetical protein